MDPSLQQSVDQPLTKRYSVRRAIVVVITTCAALGLMAVAVWFVRTKPSNPDIGTSAASNYPVASVPISSLPPLPAQTQTTRLVVNGQAQVTNGLVLQPSTTKPASAVAGELYYDKTTNQPYFYNGKGFVSLQSTGTTVQITNNSTTIQQTIVQGGGTTLSGLTVNGVAYADSSSSLKATGTATDSVLATDASGVPGLTQTLPVVVQGNITATGSLASGSISNGFGGISTTNIIATTGVLQGGSILLGSDGGLPPSTGLRGGIATGTNIVGNDLFFDAADGTGTGGSGSLVFRTGAPSIDSPTNDTNSSISSDFSTVTSLTWAHATNANPDRLLIVGVTLGDNTKTITGITYSGVALTRFAGQNCSTTCRVELWYLVAPPVGVANVVISLSGPSILNAGASTYYNVDPTTPVATSMTAFGFANPPNVTLTGTNTTQLVVDVFGDDNRLLGVTGNNILRWNTDGATNAPNGSSSLTASSPSTTMNWNDTSSSWATVVVALNPPAGTASNTLIDRLNITSTGNVGINNSNPQHALDVMGTARIQATANSTTTFQIQNASGTVLFAADTANMQVTVISLIINTELTVEGHIITGGTTPSIAAGSAACTTPSVSIVGNDTAGQISVTTGTGCAGAGVLATLTFHSAYSAVPHAQITPKNAVAAALLPYQSSTTTVLTLGVANAPANSTTYLFDYLVTQ